MPVTSWLEQRIFYLSVMGSNPRGALCTTPCVTRGGQCAMPCVTLHTMPCVTGWGCTTLCVTAKNLRTALCVMGRSALCHRARRLASPDGTGRDVDGTWTGRDVEGTERGGAEWGGTRRGGPGAGRPPKGGLCATPCVTERVLVPNALCRATPCVAEGGPVHNALSRRGCLCTTPCVGACACVLAVRATDFLPVSHGLKSQGGPCAQRLVSRGGPVRNALCHREGACAQRLVSP